MNFMHSMDATDFKLSFSFSFSSRYSQYFNFFLHSVLLNVKNTLLLHFNYVLISEKILISNKEWRKAILPYCFRSCRKIVKKMKILILSKNWYWKIFDGWYSWYLGCQEPWHQGSKVHIQLVRSISLYLQRTNLRKKRKKEILVSCKNPSTPTWDMIIKLLI